MTPLVRSANLSIHKVISANGNTDTGLVNEAITSIDETEPEIDTGEAN